MANNHAVSGRVDFTKSIDLSAVKGKTALITGGASGIGAGTVKALAAAGAHVTIADINAELGEELTAELKEAGYSANFAQTDVTSWNSQVACFKSCVSSSPQHTVDIVILCAGLTGNSIFHSPVFSSQDLSKDPLPPSPALINVSLLGVWYSTNLALHYFKATGSAEDLKAARKQIVFISSGIGYRPIPLFSDYTAVKFGVRGLWKSLRETPEMTGMRTNLIAPGLARTPMTEGLVPVFEASGCTMLDVRDVVDAIMRVVADGSIKGRAICVMPGGPYDLCDDVEGHDGGIEVAKRWKEESNIMDVMAGLMKM